MDFHGFKTNILIGAQMKKTFILILSFLAVSFNTTFSQEENVSSGILTLKNSFGDSNVPEEFLLADPTGIAVLNNGDILVCDELQLKIYNSEGKPKRIVGRRGQGPGEFTACGIPTVSAVGNLAIFASQTYWNIYDEKPNFIKRYNIGFIEDYNIIREKYKICRNNYSKANITVN